MDAYEFATNKRIAKLEEQLSILSDLVEDIALEIGSEKVRELASSAIHRIRFEVGE